MFDNIKTENHLELDAGSPDFSIVKIEEGANDEDYEIKKYTNGAEVLAIDHIDSPDSKKFYNESKITEAEAELEFSHGISPVKSTVKTP